LCRYIAASYVKFVESAGARVVPIQYDADTATLMKLFNSVNGILLPGGGVSLTNTSHYLNAGKTIYDAAVKSSKAGVKVPIWGAFVYFTLASAAVFEHIEARLPKFAVQTGANWRQSAEKNR
jgi:gamma-glutamyl hydrolase